MKSNSSSFEWSGTSEPEDKSGIATFRRCNTTIEVSMISFDEALKIDKMLDTVYKQGKNDGMNTIKKRFEEITNNC